MKRKQLKAWKVTAGTFTRLYLTEHHANQMARALILNGMSVTITETTLPDDALTRLSCH